MDSKYKRRGVGLVLLVVALALSGAAAAGPGGHGGRGGHGAHMGHGQFHGHHGHHGHFHGRPQVGVWLGSSWGYGPGWYGDPWYGYPYRYPYGRTLIVPLPPMYIEQGGVPTAQRWYYCARPQGYYPYVKSCLTPWRAVTALGGR
ncbi:hypothetical protein [Janthinobacterium lividum]|uniref:Uncharacterized protein n=1 Tax=Janthinobacterium lividum TaxID=29581 RepID=A0ABU0XVX8_9BURK|nr:hypothetical protein [Janthinobacterium lividum]MDQ4627710.1 hypothetical protein [Janthinobacterium lividum]MDQ4676528.1 hypothetical protein [Janthinobacterium lividum]MDQ4687000.1 hypothetical protein [Janthinobacterium lividum]